MDGGDVAGCHEAPGGGDSGGGGFYGLLAEVQSSSPSAGTNDYVCPFMHRFTSIFLLSLIGTLLVPWQALCLAHPFGHKPHPPGIHSACQLRKLYKSDKPAYFPPMHCKHVVEVVSAFRPHQAERLAPGGDIFPGLIHAFDRPRLGHCPAGHHRPMPELRCNTGPPHSCTTLRGPPLI